MADIRTQVLKRVEAGQFIDSDLVVDAGGNTFIVIGAQNYPPTNDTWAEVYRVAPGAPMPAQPQWRVLPAGFGNPNPQKIDAVQVYYSGGDLLVTMVTHEPGPGPRDINVEVGIIPSVFVYEEGMIQRSGGPDALSGVTEPAPDPGGTEVDYPRVEAIVAFVVQRELTGLIQQFGGQGVRQGLEDKAKDAAVELLTGNDQRAEAYKAALYSFVKNANAGVQANILGGGDAWGTARRDELKAIVREVLREGPPQEQEQE